MSTAFAATLKSAFSHLFPVCACGGTSRSSVRHIPLTVASLRVSLLLDWPMGWSARWPRGNTKPFIHKMVATFTHYWRHSSPLSRSQKGIPVSHTTSIMHNEQRTHRHSCLDFQDSAKRPEHLRQAPSLVYSERGRKPRLNPRFLNELLESRLFGQIHSQYPWNYCNESPLFSVTDIPKKTIHMWLHLFFLLHSLPLSWTLWGRKRKSGLLRPVRNGWSGLGPAHGHCQDCTYYVLCLLTTQNCLKLPPGNAERKCTVTHTLGHLISSSSFCFVLFR